MISKSTSSDLKTDLILVNPLISARSVEKNTDEEGCLSIPNILVKIERSSWIKVIAQDPKGTSLEFEARDFFARVIQHEMDHLDGVLIIDKKIGGMHDS